MTTQTSQKRYNRWDIDSTLEAAIRHSTLTETAVHVFPTAGSFMISRDPTSFGNRCYRVAVGMVERVCNWAGMSVVSRSEIKAIDSWIIVNQESHHGNWP